MKAKTAGGIKGMTGSNQPDTSQSASQIKKVCIKSKNRCKVTFRIPKELAAGAQKACLVGDFNGWDSGAHPMKIFKNGACSVTLDLETGREYQYRFFIDGRWENDPFADRYDPSPFEGVENSVVIL